MAGFRIITLAAVALSGLIAGAQAAHASPKVAILGLEVIDGGEGLDQQTTQRATWLTDELRDYAAEEHSPFDLARDGNKDLLEMKLLSGCADEALGCMAAIGRELGADRLIYGKLQKGADGYRVSLTLLDTRAPDVERIVSDQIPFTEASRSAMAAWARSLYAQLTGVAASGVLIVETNADSGTVFVNGRPRATLSGGAARVDDLEEGAHTITIEADGYAPYAERVTIMADEEELMAISLDRLGDGLSDPRRPYRIGFGATLAATGVSTGAWGISWYQYRISLRSDKNDLVERMLSLGSSRDRYGEEAQNVCDSAAADINSSNQEIAATAGDLVSTCNRGRRYAMLTPIFGAAAGLSAIASGYFYYKGYMDSEVERQPRGGRDSWSLKVSPRFGPDLVGAGLRLEF
jgi:hypothetical protein